MQEFQRLYEQGRRHFEQGEWDEALACLQPLVQSWPHRYPDVYNKIGLIYHEKGEPERAVVYLEKALSINPLYTEAALNLVITYNELGRYEEAQACFQRIARAVRRKSGFRDPYIDGRLANEHARLADQYYDLGRYKEAILEYRRALALRPRFPDILMRLGMAYRELGQFAQAVRALEKALKINPAYTAARVQLGVTYYMQGFVDMALAEWEKAREMDPDHPEVPVYLSLLQQESTP